MAVCLAAITFIGLVSRMINPAFTGDQLELLQFSSEWRWIYDEQMPLYTWIGTGLLRITGDSVFALDALKFATLAILAAGISQAAERMMHGAGLPAIALAFLIPTIGIDAQATLTHSGPLLAATAWSIAVLASAPGRPGRGFWWQLGAVWACGLLFKHSMALVIAAQILAVMTISCPARPARLKHMAAAGAMAAMVAAPFYGLLALNAGTASAGLAEFYPETGLAAVRAGILDALTSPLGEAGIVVLIGLMAFLVWPAPRLTDRRDRLLGRAGLFFMVLVTAVSLLSGASVIRDRWLAPGVLMLVPHVAAHITRGLAPERRPAASALAVVVVLATALAAGHRTAFGS